MPFRRARVALLGLAVALLAVFVFLTALNPISVTDFWWQAKAGELIVRTGRIPTRDPFSWTAAGNPWVVHEWLTEVLFYWMLTGLPRWSLLAYKAGLACVACGLVLARAWRRSGSAPCSVAATALAALVVRNYADLRPQMLTFVLLAGVLWGLDEYRRGGLRRLPWLLPPVFALWANLHGAVVVGLILVTLWVVGDWIGSRWLGEERPGWKPLLAAVAASWLAVMLNPNGFHVYLYPFQVLGHPEVQDYITEWFSPDFHRPTQRPFEVMLLLLLALAFLAWRRSQNPTPSTQHPTRSTQPGPGETLVLVAMAHAALVAQRNTAPFALAAAPVIAAGAASLWRDGFAGALDKLAARPALRLAGLALLCGVLVVSSYRERPYGPARTWLDRGIGMETFPVDAVQWMKQGRWPGRMYNDYVWGGYLIWELYPQRGVFIDGRAEVYYPNHVFEDEMKIHRVQAGWDEALRRRGVQVVVTETEDTLAAVLRASPEWELAFRGRVESVFVRREERQ